MTLARETRTPIDAGSLAQHWELTRIRRHRGGCGEPIDMGRGGAWLLVTVGSAALRVGDDRHILEAGDAALLTTLTPRSLIPSAGSEVAVGDLRSRIPVAGLRSPVILRRFAERFPPVRQLVEMCPLDDASAEPLWAQAYANMIGAATVTAWMESSPNIGHDAAVTSVIGAMSRAPGEPWTLERMASVAHLSRSALASRFRTALGTSPSAVLRELRMTEARELLTQPHYPIGAVASAVGYGSTAAFSRAFSACHGVAPQAWRDGWRGPSSARVPN